jgi:hypothetical protein
MARARGATTLGFVGEMHAQLGDPAAPLTAYRGTLAARRAALGDTHPLTAMALLNLGHAHSAAGAVPEALAALEEALPVFAESLGADHADVEALAREIGPRWRSRPCAAPSPSPARPTGPTTRPRSSCCARSGPPCAGSARRRPPRAPALSGWLAGAVVDAAVAVWWARCRA